MAEAVPDIYLNAEEGYDAIAPYYDDWEWQKIWPAIEMPHIRRMLKKDQKNVGLRVLDIGTGTGRTLKTLHEEFNLQYITGADVSREMLRRAAAWDPHLEQTKILRPESFVYLDTKDLRWHLPFDSSTYSHVLMCRVGSHIPMLSRTLAEAQRVVLPGGKIFISDIHAGHNYTDTHLRTPDKSVHIETHKHDPHEWEHAARFLNLKICFSHVIKGTEIMALPGTTPPKSVLSPGQPVSMMMMLEKL